jgi:hypothetical protein
MNEQLDKNFIGRLADKSYLANKANRAENTDRILHKLDDLRPIPLPDFPQEITVKLTGVEMIKGEKGETGNEPTDERLISLIEPLIPEPIKGDDGKDYILTAKDKKEIASKITVPVVEKIIEKIEVQQPIVTNEVKEVAIYETPEQISEKLQTLKNAWLEVKAIKGLDEILTRMGDNFLQQARGFVPNALASLYDVDVRNITNGQALIWDTTKQKFVPGATSGSGARFTNLPATGAVDGSNTTFTFTQKPTYIVSDGAWYVENSGWTWSSLTATMSVPPQTGIFGFV